jgi:hypothetical protein
MKVVRMSQLPLDPVTPKLSIVDPKTYWLSWFFAIFNLFCLGPTFLLVPTAGDNVPLASLLPNYVWGVVFVVLGLGFVYSLITNNWKLLKTIHRAGLIAKSPFGYGLLVSIIFTGNIGFIAVAGLWLFLLFTQMLCLIFFTPAVRFTNEPIS